MKLFNYPLLFFLFHFLYTFNSFAQTANLTIEVETGFRAIELSWTLYDELGNALLDDGGRMTQRYTNYTSSFEIDLNKCYRFEIRDNIQDGFTFDQGSYELRLDNRMIVSDGGDFKGTAEHYINCQHIGNTCATPIPIHTPRITSPAQFTTWYSFCPPESAVYNINTCSNISSGIPLDTDIWIYDSCPSVLSDGPVGAIAYSASESGCAPAVQFEFLQLEEGKNYLIRLELKDSSYVSPIRLDVIKTDHIIGCTDPSACNYNPFIENPTISDCQYSDCLPDLVIDEGMLKSSLVLLPMLNDDDCYVAEGCMTGFGMRQLIRFTTAFKNEGTADYIIGNHETNPAAFSYDNCHDHWHHTGYAEYLLYPEQGERIPIGFKNGFCVLDLVCDADSPIKYHCNYMGVSVGCSDIYSWSLDCQWVDVTNIPDGIYTLVVRINWTRQPDLRGKEESNYDNNWGQVCFRLDRSSGTLQMETLEDCPVYVDCLGVSRGSATQDCEGNCGGSAVYGDMNEDGKLSNQDIQLYFKQIAQSEYTPPACYDLNGNGNLSIYDVALLQSCMVSKEDAVSNNACLFPRDYFNVTQNVDFYLDNINYELGYVDIQYYAPAAKLLAFDLALTGIKIAHVEGLGHSNWKMHWQGNRLFAMCLAEDAQGQSLENLPLVRVYFQRITRPEICIEKVYDVVNSRYESINSPTAGRCQTVEQFYSIREASANRQTKLTLSPNPSLSHVGVDVVAAQEIKTIVLFGLQGQALKQWQVLGTSSYHLNLDNIEKGVYLLQIKMLSGMETTQKIVLQ